MKTSSVIVWINSIASEPARALARKVMPIGLKRSLGKRLMTEVYRDEGVTTSTDGRVFKNIEDRLFLRVCLDRTYEPILSEVAKNLIRTGDNIIDVGANFGWYSTLFGVLTGSSGKVYSYEPLLHSYNILIENISLNSLKSVVTPINKAVGWEIGTVFLGGAETSDSGLAHVVSDSNGTGVETECVTLSKEHSDLVDHVSYLKIDIEGYEYNALDGAYVLLKAAQQPILQLELNEEALVRAGSSRAKVIELVTNFGYEFYEASDEPGKIRKADLSLCSDVFCLGSGVFADRARELIVH